MMTSLYMIAPRTQVTLMISYHEGKTSVTIVTIVTIVTLCTLSLELPSTIGLGAKCSR